MGNPLDSYFQMPSNIPVTDEMKRAALTNALLQFGASMVQPQQGRNSFQKFLNAIPGSLQQGMGGYNESMMGEIKKQQTATDIDYKKTHGDYLKSQSENTTKNKELLMSLPGMVVKTVGNIPEEGYQEITLAQETANAIGKPQWAALYEKHPEIMLKAIEKLGDQKSGIIVQTPFGEMPMSDIPSWLGQNLLPEKTKTGSQNLKPFYKVDGRGNVTGNPIWLDENDPATLQKINTEGYVPPTDPRIIGNRQATNINLQLGGLGQKEITKQVIQDLGPMKKEAVTASSTIGQIDLALKLVNKGVTGKAGQWKSFIAPYAEAVGYSGENLSDAQAFQLLTRAIIGPMRLEIIGPGPVSEWEQKLMQQISGGGGAAAPAAKQLLSHWRKLATGKVQNYNDTLSGMADIDPVVSKVYKPIQIGSQSSPSGGSRDVSPARQYIGSATSREDAKARIRSLSQKGWTVDEIRDAVRGSQWE